MSATEKTARLPAELCIIIFAESAWTSATRDKHWLSVLATTSRLVWTVVKPILYETVVLTNANIHKLDAAMDSGYFSLTRRLVCRIRVDRGERHPLRDHGGLANAFSAVEHFSGRELDHFILHHLSDGAFTPHHATLILSDDFLTVKGIIRQIGGPTTRGITHLHLVLNLYCPVWPVGVPRPDPTMLTHVILEPSLDFWTVLFLVVDVLPFLLACPLLERVLVRLPRDEEFREGTWRALDDFVRTRDEERVWVLDAPADAEHSVFDAEAAFDADKWTAGQSVLHSVFQARS